MMFILLPIFLILGSIWFIAEMREKRSLWNGLFFIISYGSLAFLLIIAGLDWNLPLISSLGAMLLLVAFMFLPLFFVSLLITIISTSITLINKEGFSLSHILGILFGSVILINFIFLPTIIQQTANTGWQWLFQIISTYSGYFVFIFVIFMFSIVTYQFFPEKKNKDYIIVLGCSLNGEQPSNLLRQRLDLAIKFYHKQLKQTGKDAIFIMSGGQGSDEVISEAQAMANYALSQGIASSQIWKEDKSTNTYQNMLFSQQLINEHTNSSDYQAIFVTNNFHVFRSSLWAKKVGLHANGIGSHVKFYYYVNALIREYIGVLAFNWKFHLVVPTMIAVILVLTQLFTNIFG